MARILAFGEILWDIINKEPHLGGAPLNFAAHVRQCGHDAAIISAVGNDHLGRRALKLVEDLAVDTQMVQRNTNQTGYVPVTILDGQPDYEIIKDVAYDYISESLLDHDKIETYDMFYFGSLIQRTPISKESLNQILRKHSFKQIFYDVNLRKDCYNQQILESSLGYCTILKVNDEEVSVISKMLFGEDKPVDRFCELLIARYLQIQTIIITAGAAGAFVFSNNELVNVPTDSIQVIDTVGAGDSFSAAFASTYFMTGDPLKSAYIANKVGGFVASSAGPIPRYTEEVRRMLLT